MDKFFFDLEHVPIKNWIPSGLKCLADSVSKKAEKMLLRCLDLEGLWSGHKFVLLWQCSEFGSNYRRLVFQFGVIWKGQEQHLQPDTGDKGEEKGRGTQRESFTSVVGH